MKKLNATKSIFVEADKTKIICSLYGPNVGFSNKIEGEVRVFIEDVEDLKQKGRQDERSTLLRKWESDLSSVLTNTIILADYPKSVFELSLEIISNDGSVFSYLVNSCFLALSLAQVRLYDQISSTSAVFCGDKFILDPSKDEEQISKSRIEIVNKRNHKKLPFINTLGQLTMNDVEKALSLTLHGCADLSKLMEDLILKNLSS